MKTSQTIAGLAGPMLIALTVSEMLNPRTWDDNIAPVTYLSGSLWFLGGVAIVRAHNRWIRGWPLAVTLVGWFALVLGALRMFAPQAAQQGAANDVTVIATQVILLVFGGFLTYKAYGPDRPRATHAVAPGRFSEGWAP